MSMKTEKKQIATSVVAIVTILAPVSFHLKTKSPAIYNLQSETKRSYLEQT